MTLACDKCGTTDFAVEGSAFTLSFVCPNCRLVMCSACAGRVTVDGISALCCYYCRTTGICDAELWADRLTPWDTTAKETLVSAVNEWNSKGPEPGSLALQWMTSHEAGHQKAAAQMKCGKFSIDVFIRKTVVEPHCGYFQLVLQIPETRIPPKAGKHMDCLNAVCKFDCYPLMKPESQECIVVGLMDWAQISEVSTGRELAARAKNLAAAATSFVECMAKREPWWNLW